MRGPQVRHAHADRDAQGPRHAVLQERHFHLLAALADALGHVERAGGIGLGQEDGHLGIGEARGWSNWRIL